jgi:hypothetical protein
LLVGFSSRQSAGTHLRTSSRRRALALVELASTPKVCALTSLRGIPSRRLG